MVKVREKEGVNYEEAPAGEQGGSDVLDGVEQGDGSGKGGEMSVIDEVEESGGGRVETVDDISADSSEQEGGIAVARAPEKARGSREGSSGRADNKGEEELAGVEAGLVCVKPNVSNAGDPESSAEESEDSDDSVFQVPQHRQSVFISRKRKVLAHPAERKSREGLRGSRRIQYKDMSSSEEEEDAREGDAACMQGEAGDAPTSIKSAAGEGEDGCGGKAEGQVYYTRRVRKKEAGLDVLDNDGSTENQSKAQVVKQYRRLRKKVESPSGCADDLSLFAFDGKGQGKKEGNSQLHMRSLEAAGNTRKQPSRSCARKQIVEQFSDEGDSASDDATELKMRAGKVKATAASKVESRNKDILLDCSEEAPVSEALPYTVGQYGLCTINGDYATPKKRIGSVEKILSVRSISEERIFCVKEHLKSYRSVAYVAEKLLQQNYPHLFRNFLKRLAALGRIEGHIGDDEKGPAFDPLFIEVDRIIDAKCKGSKRSYYVKWRSLPYSDCTWEDESSLHHDWAAVRQYIIVNKPGTHFDAWMTKSAFRDGRTLRDYQEEGVAWLDHEYETEINCILADEMGLGKTIQSVAMIENLRSKRKKKGPFLVVAPISTLGHWQREVQSLTYMNCVVYGGNQEDREIIRNCEFYFEDGKRSKFHVLLTSFEILMKDQAVLSKQSWDYVVIDEAHRLKAKDSKTAYAVREVIKNVSNGGLLLLTGTPVQNNMKEIFGLLNLLDPYLFGSEDLFLSKYGDLKDAEQVKELQDQILRPRLLRRLKEDVEKSIPQKEEIIIWVELTKDQRIYYKAIYENAIPQLLKGSQTANMPNLRNVAMELRKVCNHPFLCNGLEADLVGKHQNKVDAGAVQKLLIESSGKMVLVHKLLPSLKDAGRRVLIFSQFTIMLDLLEDYLVSKQYTYERIDGKIRGIERQAAIDRYSAKGSDIFVFLLSTRAGGLGITLTAADTCIIYDSDWNPQNDLQAMARCHRIGQTKDVRIYRLITRNTYEQQLFESSSRKYGLDEAILGNRLGADADTEQMKNIENLLKNGAYDILKDDGEAEAAAFSAQNIDQILEQRTQKRLIGGSGSNTFSVARFISNEDGDDSSLVDCKRPESGTEEFWHELLPEACDAAKAAKSSKRSKASNSLQQEEPIGRRRRARVDYAENRQNSDDDSAGRLKKETMKALPSTEAAALSNGSMDSEEEGVEHWSELELKRLEERMMSLGREQIKQIQEEARLQHRTIEEVDQVMDAIVSFCQNLQDEAEVVKDIKDDSPEEKHDNGVGTPIVEGQSEVKLSPKPVFPFPACIQKAMTAGCACERLRKNSTRLLDRLHERKVLADFLKSENPLPPILPRKNKLPVWWGEKEDLDLLRGALVHGHNKFKKFRLDATLCFLQRFKESHGTSGKDVGKSLEPEDVQGTEDWPSDAVLTSRLRRLIEALPNGISERVLKRKAADIEAKTEIRNQKMVLKLEAQVERDTQKKALKMELEMEKGHHEDDADPFNTTVCNQTVSKKSKSMEPKSEKKRQPKAVDWQNTIREGSITENALKDAQIQAALNTSAAEMEAICYPAPNLRTHLAAMMGAQHEIDVQFAEYEAATRRAMNSSGHADCQVQQEKPSTTAQDTKQVKKSTPIMGTKQLVGHISPSSYVKDHEDMTVAALPLEKPVSQDENQGKNPSTSSLMMTDVSNKENEVPPRKKLSLSAPPARSSRRSHKQQTLLTFLTKKPVQ